jgi:hypothetical protein
MEKTKQKFVILRINSAIVILIATDKTRLYKAAKEPKQIHVKF